MTEKKEIMGRETKIFWSYFMNDKGKTRIR